MTRVPATIAISGSRALPPGGTLRIRNVIRSLVLRYPNVTWVAGGAIGADQTATDQLMRLGQAVRLVLPFAPLC
jgi:predicted Rossmann fold nucleotide-binding protein DprA/Smf involved in DNA uptake